MYETSPTRIAWKSVSLRICILQCTVHVYVAGWWFGTWMDYFSIYWELSSQLTNSIIFLRGWNHHQPGWISTLYTFNRRITWWSRSAVTSHPAVHPSWLIHCGSPQWCERWFITKKNFDISSISPGYWRYWLQLSYRTGAPLSHYEGYPYLYIWRKKTLLKCDAHPSHQTSSNMAGWKIYQL